MVDAKIEQIQEKKDLCLKVSLAGQAMIHKTMRYVDSGLIMDKSSILADQILAKKSFAEVDTHLFLVDNVLPVFQEKSKALVCFSNVTGSVTQSSIDKYLSSPECSATGVKFKESQLAFSSYNQPSKYQNATSLAFENTLIEGHFAHDIAGGKINELNFARCQFARPRTHEKGDVERTTIGSNALEIASKNPVVRMFLNEMSLLSGEPLKEKPLEWNTLPKTLEYLNLSKTDVINANFDGFVEHLVTLNDLAVLDLSSCGLTDSHAVKLLDAVAKTKITTLNVSGNLFGDETRQKFNDLGLKTVMNAPYFEQLLDEEIARKTIEIVSHEKPRKKSMIDQGLLFPSATKGAFSNILETLKENGEEMTPSDYLIKNKQRETLISVLAENDQLPTVFTPKNWTNTQNMQQVWDAVPSEYKQQLDGQEGRPSFQKMKNQVMSNIVKSTLASKKKQRM